MRLEFIRHKFMDFYSLSLRVKTLTRYWVSERFFSKSVQPAHTVNINSGSLRVWTWNVLWHWKIAREFRSMCYGNYAKQFLLGKSSFVEQMQCRQAKYRHLIFLFLHLQVLYSTRNAGRQNAEGRQEINTTKIGCASTALLPPLKGRSGLKLHLN